MQKNKRLMMKRDQNQCRAIGFLQQPLMSSLGPNPTAVDELGRLPLLTAKLYVSYHNMSKIPLLMIDLFIHVLISTLLLLLLSFNKRSHIVNSLIRNNYVSESINCPNKKATNYLDGNLQLS